MDNKKIIASVKALARAECANYDRGFCLLTDKRCHIINPNYESIHDGAIDCDYFLESVLPADWELRDLVAYALWYDEDEPKETHPRNCACCGGLFLPQTESSRQVYCNACSRKEEREKHAKRSREYRMRKHMK